MIPRHFRRVFGAVAAAVGITATGFTPAHAAVADPIPVGLTSPCQDVVVLGAAGSGQTSADSNGFGSEAALGLGSYARQMDGYKVGYATVSYPSADVDTLLAKKTSKNYFDSIDEGVVEALDFLSQREPACRGAGERYVFMGYSQGAMVMHRVLWQLAGSNTKYSALAEQLLPRLDGVLVIGDGDRVANQGGASYGTAPAGGSGIWWAGATAGATSARYKPIDRPVPNLPSWPAARFHSVCFTGDLVCDYSTGMNPSQAKDIHEAYTGPIDMMYVQSAAESIANTSKELNPKENATAVPVRVGQKVSAIVAPDGRDVLSVEWLSDPIPNTELSPGMPTIPATLTWSPTVPGVVNYSVRVNFTDGTSKDVSGSLQAFAVPAPSLSVVNLQTAYSADPALYYPRSTVTFDVVKTTPSDTTPYKGFSDREDPASDYYYYVGGDANGDNVLDIGESWSYTGSFDWGPWEPGTVRTRTVLVYANDASGAGAWIDAEVPVTLTR